MSGVPAVVVAAVIEREGRVLICRRRADDRYPLKWEFPGGKVEPWEDPREALRRELREELGVAAEIGPEIMRYSYQYPDRPPILLIFLRVAITEAPQNRVFEEIRWEPLRRLPELDFLEGDREFLEFLTRGRG